MFIAAGHAMQGHHFTVRLVGLQFSETAFRTAVQSKISDLLFYTNLEISAKICTHILFKLKKKKKDMDKTQRFTNLPTSLHL